MRRPKPRTIVLNGFLWSRLRVNVIVRGPHWFRFCPYRNAYYDFADDVRELICEPLRPEVYAMWTDPWERWT